MDYEPPAIERRVPADKPVIEGVVVGSGNQVPNPIWKRETDAEEQS